MADPSLRAELDAIFARRVRDDMEPTIRAFLAVLAAHPDDPEVLYEVGGSYDTAGQEQTAAGYYERAFAAGLDGDSLRKCLMQYGSTLRNLERYDESLAAFARGRALYPGSEAMTIFEALSLHAAGRSDAAVGSLLRLIAERLPAPDVSRYEAAIRGNAEFLLARDADGTT